MNASSNFNQCLHDINISLHQVQTLIHVLMNSELATFNPDTLFNYLWVISNITAEAKKISEKLLN